ncbi:MAG: hypothetical protein A3F70_09875 [Acidobacteria bacterium RIFCSPLOWO2_12_FULL_67_14]|nr:MAG: hypothetical protein A3H29_00085 [Acidobacteria bacterium RIFCSPLOWO2_02_FULL_67_21]OFW38059.1 MAG: hypothetical protein A3F70_09875 [Acidobacteria bacterium RIFCSPLOWO2_12_FULL_67_14]
MVSDQIRSAATSTLFAPEPIEFELAVRSRSWEWLLALRLRLAVDLQLLDEHCTPMLSRTQASLPVDIVALLRSEKPAVRNAVLAALRTRLPQTLVVGSARVICFPISAERVTRGVLIAARVDTAGAQEGERATAELLSVGEWLCNGVEAHLSSSAGDDLKRVSTLLEVLDAAAAGGSDREVLLAWAEVLAVWHDTDVYAYVDDLRGHFVYEAALPGAAASAMPAIIDAAVLPESSELVVLSKADAERLQLVTGQDVTLWRTRSHPGWLLVLCGAGAAHHGVRVRVYARLLEQAMRHGAQASAERCVVAMSSHLFNDDQQDQHNAEQAAGELREILGLAVVSVIVRSVAGAPLIVVDDWERTEVRTHDPASRLVVLRRVEDQFSLVLGVARADGRHITPQEVKVVEVAADLLERWAMRVVRRSHAAERRSAPRRFDDVVEEFAAHAVERGVPVTAVVVSLRDRSFASVLTQDTMARLRKHMRASDLVGMLSEGEIGLLLHGTPVTQAPLVASRVRQIMQESDAVVGSIGVSIGFASRNPGDPKPGPILRDARAAVGAV